MSVFVQVFSVAIVAIVLGLCVSGVDGNRRHHHNHHHRNGNQNQARHHSQHHSQHHTQHQHQNQHRHHHQETPVSSVAGESGEQGEDGPCDVDEYLCRGTADTCIPTDWRCDNDPDCPQGDDETGCQTTCSRDEFICRNGNCVPNSWRCDGEEDCIDGSDERHCHSSLQSNAASGHSSQNRVKRRANNSKK